MSAAGRVLLLSNSTQHGRGYLDHAADALQAFLGPRGKVAFVPYAEFDLDGYAEKAGRRLAALGCTVESVHRRPQALAESDAVFVGGGNTFRLLHRLYAAGLVATIRQAVAGGLAYVAPARARSWPVPRSRRRRTCRSSSRRRSMPSCLSRSARTTWTRTPARRTWGRRRMSA